MKFNSTDEAVDALALKIPVIPAEQDDKDALVFLVKRFFNCLERIARAADKIAAVKPDDPSQAKLL